MEFPKQVFVSVLKAKAADLMHRFLSAVPHEVFAKRGFVGRIS